MTKESLIKRLETTCFGLDPIDPLRLLVDDVVEALREHAMREVQRLGQEIEQEPIGTVKELFTQTAWERLDLRGSTKVYLNTTPPQRTWVGLTDEEYDEIWRMDLNNKDIMDKTIAKLKQKNMENT